MSIAVREVDAGVTRALRLAVLRDGAPGYSTAPGDAPGARHLAALDGGTVVGAAVLLPEPCPRWPDRPAWRLRGMAVAPERQGAGVGRLVLDAAIGVAPDLLWCNARSTAVGFYARHGFDTDGVEFVTGDTGLPHLMMWREPRDRPTSS